MINSPSCRLTLNIHEFFVLDAYQAKLRRRCFAVALWTLVAGSVSHLLLTVNSSINILLYCLVSTEFRQLFVVECKSLVRAAVGFLNGSCRGRRRQGLSSGATSASSSYRAVSPNEARANGGVAFTHRFHRSHRRDCSATFEVTEMAAIECEVDATFEKEPASLAAER